MIGLDTGFFAELLRNNQAAVSTWKALIEEREEGAVSCLTLFELERLGLKGVIEGAGVLLEAIPAVCRLRWISADGGPETLSTAAALSYGTGIPRVDSIILAGLLSERVRTILTTDSHLETYRKKGLQILNMRSETG